jgi:hypothetical protein
VILCSVIRALFGAALTNEEMNKALYHFQQAGK